MNDKLKNTENTEAQIINHEDVARHNNRTYKKTQPVA